MASIGLRAFARLLRVARNDLHFVRRDRRRLAVIHLEGYVLDKKCPDFIAEAVGIKASLKWIVV